MFQSSGPTGAVNELQLIGRIVRAGWSAKLCPQGKEVKLSGVCVGIPDGTKVQLEYKLYAIERKDGGAGLSVKDAPTEAKVKDGRFTAKWTVALNGGDDKTIAALVYWCSCPDVQGPVKGSATGSAAIKRRSDSYLLVAKYGAVLQSIDEQFCPGTERLEIRYDVSDPSDYVRAGVLRVYGNMVEGKKYPEKEALVYERLLEPREFASGTHEIRWEGYSTAKEGPFKPEKDGLITYVNPHHSPYVVQIQLLDRPIDKVESWPQDDALPSLPSPIAFEGVGLKDGADGFEPMEETETDKPVHAGFAIRFMGVQLELGDYAEREDTTYEDTTKFYQYRLNKLGYFCGPVDGAVGDLTNAGIFQFKRTHWETKPDSNTPTGLAKDYEKPIGGYVLSDVTDDLDDKTKDAIKEEIEPREFLQILGDDGSPSGETNRLPVFDEQKGKDEKAKIIVDGDIPYQKGPEFDNKGFKSGNQLHEIPGSVRKQEREKKWLPRPWLPVFARPCLMNRKGEQAKPEESRFGVGPARVLFRTLEPPQDITDLGFPAGAYVAPATSFSWTAHRVRISSKTIKQTLDSAIADEDDRKTTGYYTTAGGWGVTGIWNHVANKPLRSDLPSGFAPATDNLPSGCVLQIPRGQLFTNYEDYKKHRGTYTDGGAKKSRPEQYVVRQVENNKGTAPTVDGYKDFKYHNCPAKIGTKENYGQRDKDENLRGIEYFRHKDKVPALGEFKTTEEDDKKLGKGKVVAVPCLMAGAWRGSAALFFVPSNIAGDSWRVEAEVDLEKKDKDTDHPNKKVLEKLYEDRSKKPLTGRTGVMTLWKRLHMAKYVYVRKRNTNGDELYGANRVADLTWSNVQARFKKAFIELKLPESGAEHEMTQDEYKSIMKMLGYTDTQLAAAPFDAGFWTTWREQFVPTAEQISTYAAAGESNVIDYYSNHVSPKAEDWRKKFMLEAVKFYRKKTREGWLIVDARRYVDANVLYNQKLSGTERTGGYATLALFRALITTAYSSISGEQGALFMDQRDDNSADTLFAHEMAHGVFLYHYLYAGDTSPTHHDTDEKFCVMNYNDKSGTGERGKTKLEFCGKCLLRLRGWNEQALPGSTSASPVPASSGSGSTSASGEGLSDDESGEDSPTEVKISSADAGADGLSIGQGLAPVKFEVDIVPETYRGRIRLSIQEAEGDHGRQRNRSGQGQDGYLSRLRITRNENGIQDAVPLPFEFDYAAGAEKTFYVLGLERGTETIEAELIGGDNLPADPLVGTMKVTVQRADTNVGSLRVFHAQLRDHFLAADPEFTAVYGAQAQNHRRPEVALGVMDTGIWREPNGLFSPNRLRGGRMFVDPPAAVANEVQADNPATYNAAMQDFHGNHVAGQAAFGTDRIKLLDVKVGNVSMQGLNTEGPIMNPGIAWAVHRDQGALVVTTSVIFKWNQGGIPDLIRDNPSVLFVSTGGNSNTTITDQTRGEFAGSVQAGNAILAGGCQYDRGSGAYTEFIERGRGPGVDLMVPGDYTALYCPRDARVNINRIDRLTNPKWREYDAWEDLKAAYDEYKAQHPEPAKPQMKLKIENRAEYDRQKAQHDAWVAEMNAAGVQDPGRKPREPEPKRAVYDPDPGTGNDSGISFGVPVVANIACKLRLINQGLTAAQVRQMLIDTSDRTEGFDNLCKAKGVVNPLRAYLAAYDAAQG